MSASKISPSRAGGARVASAFATALSWWAFSSSAAAQDPPPAPPQYDEGVTAREPQQARTLAGHRFVPFRVVTYPFLVSRVGASMSVGVADVDLLVLDIPRVGDRFQRDGTLGFIDSTFTGQIQIVPQLALRIGAAVGVTGGADLIGAIDVGANAGAAADAGLSLRLFRGDRAQLTLAVDGRFTQVVGIMPSRLLQSVVVVDDQIEFRSIDVAYDARVLRLDPTLAVAIAIAPWLGLQLAGGYTVRHIENIGRQPGATEHSLQAGVGLSLFFRGVSFLFGGRVVHDFNDDFEGTVISAIEPLDPTRGEAEVGVYYMAHPELDLGFVGIGTLSPDDRRVQGTLVLAYYFEGPGNR